MNVIKGFFNHKNKNQYLKFADSELLFMGLKSEEPDAIKYIFSKVSTPISIIGKDHGLSYIDIEDLICESIATFLIKLRENKYNYQGFEPTSYIIEIAKFKSKNKRRQMIKFAAQNLEEISELQIEEVYESTEEMDRLDLLFKQIDPRCQEIIKLKYFEELSDAEIVRTKLTPYKTIDSLKNQRSKCMKKMIELGKTFS